MYLIDQLNNLAAWGIFGMKLLVKDICGIFMISSSNTAAWQKIDAAVDNAIKEQKDRVELDFKDVMVMEPWLNAKFKEFMAKNTANLILYNEDTANYIQTLCMAGGMGTNRVKLIKMPTAKTESKEEKVLKRVAEDWQSIIEIDKDNPNSAVLQLDKRLQALTNDKTIGYIRETIKLFNSRNPSVRKFVIQTNKLLIESFSVKSIGQMCHELRTGTPALYVRLQNFNKDVENNCRISAAIGNQKDFESTQSRLREIRNRLKKNRVGLLMAYAKTRSTDVMGRSGSGAIKSCQPAIFLGVSGDGSSENFKLKFEVFDLDSFYTQVHWAVEHDGEEHKIKHRTVEIPVSKCGLYGVYLGRDYHFNEPIQYHNGVEQGTVINYTLNDESKTQKQTLTIPAFIKAVFEDYGIETDYEYLNNCIERTHEIIKHNDGQLLADM